MLSTLKLFLPALIPSWRFFDVIAPSPRVEFACLQKPDAETAEWREFRPRPERLSPLEMLGRLFWNPRWNESLFLVSCAERLIANPTDHSRDEIFARILAELTRTGEGVGADHLQFRLVFISREGDALEKQVLYVSPVDPFTVSAP